MNTNDLVYKIAKRALELGDMNVKQLRSWYPIDAETHAESLREVKRMGFSRGQMIEAILCEEFVEEFPKEIEE